MLESGASVWKATTAAKRAAEEAGGSETMTGRTGSTYRVSAIFTSPEPNPSGDWRAAVVKEDGVRRAGGTPPQPLKTRPSVLKAMAGLEEVPKRPGTRLTLTLTLTLIGGP